MTLQECYAAMGGDYEDVSARLRSDRLVQKFVLKYLDDPSFDLLCASMAEKDYEQAFRAAHTIKGVCQNLGFTQLLDSSSQLSDALRHGWTPEAKPLAEPLAERVKADHLAVTAAIRAFRDECGGQ